MELIVADRHHTPRQDLAQMAAFGREERNPAE
jgi:hypothetical protein